MVLTRGIIGIYGLYHLLVGPNERRCIRPCRKASLFSGIQWQKSKWCCSAVIVVLPT